MDYDAGGLCVEDKSVYLYETALHTYPEYTASEPGRPKPVVT